MKQFMILALIVMILTGATEAGRKTLIDLEVESIQIQPPQAYSNTEITVVAEIRNNGSESAEGLRIRLTLYQGHQTLKTIEEAPVLSRLPRSGIGQSLPVELGLLSPGEYEIEAEIGTVEVIVETNGENNRLRRKFTVKKPPFVTETYGYQM